MNGTGDALPPEAQSSEGRARRYAVAVTRGAAAEAVITELTQRLEESEWHREAAESQLSAIEFEGVGTVVTADDPEPEEEGTALVCLRTGTVIEREAGPSPGGWRRVIVTGYETRYTWPLSNLGPFAVAPDAKWNALEAGKRYAAAVTALNSISETLGQAGLESARDGAERTWAGSTAAVSSLATRAKQSDRETEALRVRVAHLETLLADAKAASVTPPPETVLPADATAHQAVLVAESLILGAGTLPESGDPVYEGRRLRRAAAVLLAAAERATMTPSNNDDNDNEETA